MYLFIVLIDWRPPLIELNKTAVSEAEICLPVGTRFTLSCRGNSSVSWKTSPRSHSRHIKNNLIRVKEATVIHTGRYKCLYDERPELHSELYIYITSTLSTVPPSEFSD